MGCDTPLTGAKKHEFVIKGDKVIMDTCPHKNIAEVSEYFRAAQWAKEGRLQFLYREDALPAAVGQAIDLITYERYDSIEDMVKK